MKLRAIQLYLQGFSVSQIAKLLKHNRATIYRWIKGLPQKRMGRPRKVREIPNELIEKLKALLLDVNEEKGRKRTHSLRRIYHLLELDLRLVGINSLASFYRLVEDFVKSEWGSWERLEVARRGIKEAPKVSKGKVQREKGLVEIDATGYVFAGKQYSILFALELYSMRILGFYTVENKEKNATHYNKAFSSLDVAKFMFQLFLRHGVPKAVKTDNEKILTSEHITRALKELGVEIRRTKPYQANQKLIERVIRELKDIARTIKAGSINDLISLAINTYNRTAHNFEHFQKPVAPAEVELQGFSEVDEGRLRKAFAERFERTIRNHTITIDNLRYEFYLPQEEKELGRAKNAPRVICLRDIEDITKLEVYASSGEFLGYARLVSTELPSLDPVEYKQHKQKSKRVEKREEKLREELRELQEARISETQEEDILCLLSSPAPEPEPQEGVQEEEWDILKIYEGG